MGFIYIFLHPFVKNSLIALWILCLCYLLRTHTHTQYHSPWPQGFQSLLQLVYKQVIPTVWWSILSLDAENFKEQSSHSNNQPKMNITKLILKNPVISLRMKRKSQDQSLGKKYLYWEKWLTTVLTHVEMCEKANSVKS